MEREKTLQRHPIWIILLTAAIIRIGYIAFFADHWRFYDTIHYETAAKNVAEGKGFGPSLHFGHKYSHYCLEPIYPLFIALTYIFFGTSVFAVRLAQVLLSLFHLYLLYDIARTLWSRRTALAVLLFAAVYPFYIMIAGLVYPTQLFATLLLLLVWCLLRYQTCSEPGYLLLGGITYGLALQTGPVLMISVPLVLLWLWRFSPLKQNAISIFLGVTLLTILPWTIRNYIIFDKIAPGRGCLEEQRFINSFYYQLQDTKAFQSRVFPGNQISVYFSTKGNTTYIDGYLDGRKIVTMKPLDEQLPIERMRYLGVLFEGKYANELQRLIACQLDSVTQDRDVSRCLDSANDFESIATAKVHYQKPSFRLDGAMNNQWQNQLICQQPMQANYFEMTLPDSVSPEKMRRIALLLYLDQPTFTANGYMFWLQPCLEFDLWKVTDGKPTRPLTMEKIYWEREDISLIQVLLHEPKGFLLNHFLPEFLNFWSPVVKRITTGSQQPSGLLQLASLFFFLPLIIFAPIGMFYKRRSWPFLSLSIIFILAVGMGYSVFSTEVRYRIPIDSLLILWAAGGLAALWERWFSRGGHS